jgi:hypothetical protein
MRQIRMDDKYWTLKLFKRRMPNPELGELQLTTKVLTPTVVLHKTNKIFSLFVCFLFHGVSRSRIYLEGPTDGSLFKVAGKISILNLMKTTKETLKLKGE